MFCQKCGHEYGENTKFCPSCGAPNPAAQQTGNGQPNQQGYQQPNYQQQGYQQPNYQNAPYGGAPGGYRVPIQNRSIATCIILSIVTCGIYGIYWFVCMVNDLNTASKCPQDTSGGMVFLLSIVTCGIYMIYWLYKSGDKINYIRQRNGATTDNNTGLLYMLLAIFGLSIVSWCLMQNELNNVATAA